MTGAEAAGSGSAVAQRSAVDRWISRAASVTVAGLAGIAGAISYSHMRQLARDHGQAGWHAHAFPLSVDGIEIVASLVLLANRLAGRRSGWLPWTALVIGTAGSLAANVATAGPGAVSRVIAGWPALALLIAVKLLSGILGQHAEPVPLVSAEAPSSSSGSRQPSQVDRAGPALGQAESAPRIGPADRTEPGDQGEARQQMQTQVRVGAGMAADVPPGVADLLPAARTARDGLRRDGQRLSRNELAARLRQDGHRVSNGRLTQLLRALRSETP